MGGPRSAVVLHGESRYPPIYDADFSINFSVGIRDAAQLLGVVLAASKTVNRLCMKLRTKVLHLIYIYVTV
jgi:hypothetical protein